VRSLGVLAVLIAGLTAAGASQAPAYPGCAPAPDLHFRAADGTRLIGHRWGRGPTAVVLAHQTDGDVCQWAPYAKRLASLGYTAIAFDFRSYGLSQRRTGLASLRLSADISAAVKLARSQGARHVIVVGASFGANAAVVAAANTRPPIDGVVSLSAPASFRMDAVAAAKKLQVPVLYAAAEVDEGGIYATDARTLFDATPGSDKQLAIVPGAAHGVHLIAGPGKVRTLLERFIRAHATS
jgi:pimeloyl-ACP methyl ester carboxylesterase